MEKPNTCIFVKRDFMKRPIFAFTLLFTSLIWSQQLVINELDANDASTDDQEFIELKSTIPNFATDGYILVFFNGNNTTSGNNLSYLVLDLNGYTTDSNGLLVLGNRNVSPFPQVVISDGLFQNGADAVGIYQASISDFPEETSATQVNLIDALVYDTDSVTPDDTDLMVALGVSAQYNEGSNVNNSLQRQSDGTFVSAMPTPRQLNDGSGVIFNAIKIEVPRTQYEEGDVITINFTAHENVTSDVTFSIAINNGSFDASDFTGNLTLTIPNGQNTVSTTLNTIDDTDDEGDEVIRVRFLDLVEPIVASNNWIETRVVDNDFTVATWGTPINPTHGLVSSTQPIGYYDNLNGKSGDKLRQALQGIIADPNVVRAQTYAEAYIILEDADQNPLNSNQVWLAYTEQGRAKLDRQITGSSEGKWNREHTFPRSRAPYFSIEEDDIIDGIDIFWTTKADSLRHGNSDVHALRAADGGENSSRGNQNYGPDAYDGPIGNAGSFKGDIARSVLYLTLRYNGLEIINGYPTDDDSNDGTLGDLVTLLQWHEIDAPDDFEMNRNNIIYTWQKNRNPLIDMPELVDYIWGDKVGQVWNNTLSTSTNDLSKIKFYPNPTTKTLNFEGLNPDTQLEIYSIDGRKIKDLEINNVGTVDLNLPSGVYLIKLTHNESVISRKIIIE
jgi:hypothetical protein